jgi:hypothetical protein
LETNLSSLDAATFCCCIVTENTNDASAAVINKLHFIDFIKLQIRKYFKSLLEPL